MYPGKMIFAHRYNTFFKSAIWLHKKNYKIISNAYYGCEKYKQGCSQIQSIHNNFPTKNKTHVYFNSVSIGT